MFFQLYSTLGCHLCEEAKILVEQALGPAGTAWAEVEIAESELWVETYGVRIPVLRNTRTGEELGWPFDPAQLLQWLETQSE